MSNEDKYAADRDQEKIAKIRKERQLAAIRKEEKEGIARLLDSDEALAEEALDLGFDQKTVAILHLVPLLEVAWQDGLMSVEESEAVLKAAHSRGIERESEAHEFLKLLLSYQPSKSFFERTRSVIYHILKDNDEEKKEILEQIEAVADASGGLFGWVGRISAGERELIADLKTIFKL